MSDAEKDKDERLDFVAAPSEYEKLDDIEPGEGDTAAVKGGGPKEQQSLPGGGPTD